MKDSIKLAGKSYQESLIIIRDARIGGLNYIQIAERLGLDAESVFRAHLKLMKRKLLAWKPEYYNEDIEIPDPKKEGETIKQTVQKVNVTWYIPNQPEKKHKMKWKFNFKLNKNRGQTKKEIVRDEKEKPKQ